MSFTQGYVDWVQAESSTYLATVPELSTLRLALVGFAGFAAVNHAATSLGAQSLDHARCRAR